MQRMWRQMFAAVVGVLTVAGLASAQSPNQIPLPLPPAGVQATPAQAPQAPARVAGTPVIAAGAIQIRGSGGCNGCAPAPTIGSNCNNGCGSFKSDCGFMFGSCKSFFDPCGPGASGCGFGGARGHLFGGGCGGLFGGKCPPAPYGTPYGLGLNMCHYDSFLNH